MEGFEPPTFWFVAKRSIQLGYTRLLGLLNFMITAPLSQPAFLCLRKANPLTSTPPRRLAPARLASPLAAWQLGYTRLLGLLNFMITAPLESQNTFTNLILPNQDFISSLFLICRKIHQSSPFIFRKRCTVFYKFIYCLHLTFILRVKPEFAIKRLWRCTTGLQCLCN